MESLTELITNKGFDNYQNGLLGRFSANNMNYNYVYMNVDNYNSILLTLNKNNIKTQVEIKDNGELIFQYNNDGINQIEEFQNCSANDFHLMIAHAFIYLRDGNFNYHKEWYNKLDKR